MRHMRWLTLDGPDDVCTQCGGRIAWDAGENVVGDELRWFVESRCTDCDDSFLECGKGFIPARELVMELSGRWRLRVDQGSDVGVPVLRFLRRVYGLTIDEARQRRDEFVGSGLSGTRGEMVWLRQKMAALGVTATITMETPGTQAELPER